MTFLNDAYWANQNLDAEFFPASELVVRCGGDSRLMHVLEASSPEQRRLGLMFRYRTELQHDGMLFRYPSEVIAAFHMANTWMPLRVYWFDAAGDQIGYADLEAHSSKEVAPDRPFLYALEVPMDVALRLGDSVNLIV